MHSVVRVLAVAGLAAVSLTCADRSVSGLRGKLAFLPIAPAWIQGPDGGPNIEVELVRGVLRTSGGTDSLVTEGNVEGDSAVLEFIGVSVTGDSTNYTLGVQAYDTAGVLVFTATDTIAVKPGDNAPATPDVQYAAPDASVTSVDIQAFGVSKTTQNLQWAGARSGSSCLSQKNPASTTDTISAPLTVVGKNALGAIVPNTRIGWKSLDESVATVDEAGLVRSRCARKATKVVATHFLGHTDTITVDVFAPPFTLLMSPETATLARGSSQQFQAVVIDENGNQSAASSIQWTSSDPTRATVNGSGLVTALRNGRVQISATADGRITIANIDVVRPQAAAVKIIPQKDTLAIGQVRQFIARALDAAGNVIADAANFQWSSSNTAIASIDAASGAATAKTVGPEITISASLDGQTGNGALKVETNLPPGTIAGVVRDGATDAVVASAKVRVVGGDSVFTDGTGRFSLPGVRQGDDLEISKTGTHTSITFFDAPAFPNQTIFVDDIPLPPTGANSGMTGKVLNAINGSGVQGIRVRLYQNLNSQPSPIRTTATAIDSTTTSSGGTFSFSNKAVGAYTVTASGSGYGSSVGYGVVVAGQNKAMSDVFLPPTAPSAGALYVVMTWGAAGGTNVPADLDLYVTGPAPTSATDTVTRFQVHSGNRARVVGVDTVATIDVADNTGPGPEIASVRTAAGPGNYRFYVRNISHASAPTGKSLADSSDVRVDVFQGDRVIATFLPPAGQAGTVWEVFRFDGARLVPVGVMSGPAAGATLPRIVETPATPTNRPEIPVRRR